MVQDQEVVTQANSENMGKVTQALENPNFVWRTIKGLSKGQTNVNELVAMSIIGAVSLGWYV